MEEHIIKELRRIAKEGSYDVKALAKAMLAQTESKKAELPASNHAVKST